MDASGEAAAPGGSEPFSSPPRAPLQEASETPYITQKNAQQFTKELMEFWKLKPTRGFLEDPSDQLANPAAGAEFNATSVRPALQSRVFLGHGVLQAQLLTGPH